MAPTNCDDAVATNVDVDDRFLCDLRRRIQAVLKPLAHLPLTGQPVAIRVGDVTRRHDTGARSSQQLRDARHGGEGLRAPRRRCHCELRRSPRAAGGGFCKNCS